MEEVISNRTVDVYLNKVNVITEINKREIGYRSVIFNLRKMDEISMFDKYLLGFPNKVDIGCCPLHLSEKMLADFCMTLPLSQREEDFLTPLYLTKLPNFLSQFLYTVGRTEKFSEVVSTSQRLFEHLTSINTALQVAELSEHDVSL